jgi:REP element-mobilizing transposase RayT
MSQPRQILPGTTYLITKSCTQRQFLLNPSKLVNQVFSYCLAYAQGRYNIEIHACTVMSNHWHSVVTDVDGQLPEFMGFVNEFVAKCLNVAYRRQENLFSTRPYSAVTLETPEDILHATIYVLANAVEARAVDRAHLWPGLSSAGMRFGDPALEVDRPKVFFRRKGEMPDQVSLVLTRPPGFRSMSDHEFTILVRRRLRARERSIRNQYRKKRLSFEGPEACLRHRINHRPARERPLFKLSPRVAAKEKSIRVAALARLKEFAEDYRRARERWIEGERDVEFPPGTYWLRVHANVKCRAPT